MTAAQGLGRCYLIFERIRYVLHTEYFGFEKEPSGRSTRGELIQTPESKYQGSLHKTNKRLYVTSLAPHKTECE